MAKPVNSFTGHRPLEKGKYAEIRKFINLWLQEPQIYCGSCGFPYFPNEKVCCEHPQIGRNIDHCQLVIWNNKETLSNNLNVFGSNSGKTWRHGVSMPVDLMQRLEEFCKDTMGQKLFVNKKDFRGFMKSFPQFTTCERI